MSHATTDGLRRTDRRRLAWASTLLASAALIIAPAGALDAATPARTGQWSAGPERAATRHHVASARVAAASAAETPRRDAGRLAIPKPRITIDHPAKAGGAPLAGVKASGAAKPLVVSPPDVAVTTQFTGLAQAEAGDWYPPDPWVAVNSSYIIQSVNSMIRVSNRVGTQITSIPVWALFSLTADQVPSDPRVIWDATHGRWVAEVISFKSDATFSTNYLNLAVSDSADPTGGWSVYAEAYADAFPDYPSIASSNDKIVIADNLIDATGTFLGADLNTFTWASILGGGPLTYNFCGSAAYATPRAAQVLSSGNDVQLVMESTSDAGQWYWRLTGAGTCGAIVDGQDLTLDLGFSPFTKPPDAREATGDTLVAAMDERPTDAIFQNGSLWWVSTFPVTYDAGATFNDAVILWNAIVNPTTHVLSPGNSQMISAGDGIDDFMGGIGLSRNGTLFAVYSESSSADYISVRANRVPSGGNLGTPLLIESGDASLGHERWGDFAGVAMDPVGTGTVWGTHEVAAGDGSWRTVVARLVVDGDDPSAPGVLAASVVTPTTLTGSSSVRVSWGAASDASSGNVTYQIDESVDGAGFGTPSATAGLSTVRSMRIGHTYQFEVRAVDAMGHLGPWRVGPAFKPYLYQQTSGTVYTGSWSTSTSSKFSGGSVRNTSTAGRYATFTATSARSIAIVTSKGPTRGSFKVYVDGVYKATISTYSSTYKYRQVVYQYSWSTPGTHKVKILVKGTSGHPRVDVDAFVVLK